MRLQQGFTLLEVLVSLMLMTTTSLAMLKYQWHLSQLFNHLQLRYQAFFYLDNASEFLRCELSTELLTGFRLQRTHRSIVSSLQIRWHTPYAPTSAEEVIQREVVEGR